MTNRPGNRWMALAVLSLAQLMVILDSTIVNIALPSAQADLGFSADDRQWVVTGYALVFGSLLLLGGRLSDYAGRRQLFVVGVAGFAAASAVGGAASGFGMLLAARVAQGAFGAMLAPAALSLVSVTFPGTFPGTLPGTFPGTSPGGAAERGRAFGIFGAVSGAGGAIGLLLGGLLTQGISWRWCLYVNLPIAAVALAGALVWLRDGERPARVRLDVAGTLTSLFGLVGIVYGLGNAEAHGWGDVATLGPVLAGLVLVVAFVLVERQSEHPLLPLPVVLDRGRGAAYLSVGISGIGSFAVFLFLTYYLVTTLGFTPLQTGAAFLPMVALVMVGAVFSGAALLPRFGPRPLVTAGCVLGAAAMAMLTGIGAGSSYAGGVLPALLVLGLGLGFVFGPVQNAATSGVRSGDAGVASAMVTIAQQIGGSVGLAVFSSLSASVTARALATGADAAGATLDAYHLVFWIAAALFAASAALAAALFHSGPLPVAPSVPVNR